MRGNGWRMLVVALGAWWAALAGAAAANPGQWERHVSRHFAFTVVKPRGWVVQEGMRQRPAWWQCTVAHPQGYCQSSMAFGVSPTGRNVQALARTIITSMAQQSRNFRLSPRARKRQQGHKTIYTFEGTYTDAQNRPKEFRALISGGDGTMLSQRIDAPQGQLRQWAPTLLQTLANMRIARHGPTEPGAAQTARPVQLVQRPLAGGWGGLAVPRDWRQHDLGKGSVIATDRTARFFFIAASASFYSPAYARYLPRGALISSFCSPSDALAKACTQQGLGSNFRLLQRHKRPDLVRVLVGGLTGGRPCDVEDFLYTFVHKGRAYKGLSCGATVGNYAKAGMSLIHLTVWAPANEFDAALPTLGRIMGSYHLNRQKVGTYIAQGLARYYAGIAKLSNTIARNSEQMRRENLALHMQRGRVQDYVSYQTTRMIMGEFDYLAGSSGYVRGDHTGLYDERGQKISPEPWGESITRHMTEINSRELYEQVFRTG